MPLVQITLARGRTAEQLQALGEAVTAAVHEAVGAPRENVRVVITECEPEHWFVGGESLSELRASGRPLMLVPLGEPGGAPRVVTAADGRRFAVFPIDGGFRVTDAECPHNRGPLARGPGGGPHARLPVALVPLRPRLRVVPDLPAASARRAPRRAGGRGLVRRRRREAPNAFLVRASARPRPVRFGVAMQRTGGALFRRSERRDDAPDDATRAARAAASQAFLALDDEQRAAADAVRTADELGGGRPLGPEWAQVARAGDRATEAYLATTAQFPLDGTGPVAGARQADERALREIEAARETIRRFRSTHARTLDEAAHLLRALPVAVQEARTALVAARTAVQTADASGTRSRRAAEQLAEAERAAAGIDAAGGTSANGGRSQCGPSSWPARRPRSQAKHRGPPRACGRRSPASPPDGRPRPPRRDRIPPALSALRREFSEPCSTDLSDAEEKARAALGAVDRAIAHARERADAGEWDDAADAIAEARAQLGVAEQAHDAVTGRLADLREVRADPAKLAADARFVLRDAQRLVVDRGLVKRFGPILDAQSVRLRNAQDRLTGVHPDYWLYLSELRGVRRAGAGDGGRGSRRPLSRAPLIAGRAPSLQAARPPHCSNVTCCDQQQQCDIPAIRGGFSARARGPSPTAPVGVISPVQPQPVQEQ